MANIPREIAQMRADHLSSGKRHLSGRCQDDLLDQFIDLDIRLVFFLRLREISGLIEWIGPERLLDARLIVVESRT